MIRLHPNPLHCPGAYTLDCYCKYEASHHEYNEFPHSFIANETGAVARRKARKAGWILHRDGLATCPKCAKALKTAVLRNLNTT